MAFELVGLFAILELHYIAVDGATVEFQTDLPGNAIETRDTLTLESSAVRRTIKFRLIGETKGRLYKVKITSDGVVILFGGRIFARPLGGNSIWQWYTLNIPPTSDEWTPIPLPIDKTGDWQDFPLPIPKTGEWEDFALPIPKTPDEFTPLPIPMDKTPDLQEWIDLPVAK